ncbi:hypothetical protein SBA2_610007 [Acidobacteriia bacterium SbA2]|nr:hypothetical protein SBA2_610007 [Acidobacteriia bacterium SbA2]
MAQAWSSAVILSEAKNLGSCKSLEPTTAGILRFAQNDKHGRDDFPVSIFQFQFSSFEFRFSNFDFGISARRQWRMKGL